MAFQPVLLRLGRMPYLYNSIRKSYGLVYCSCGARLAHMVELTEEEFGIIYDALKTVNDPFSDAEVSEIVTKEYFAWVAVQQAADRNAPTGEDNSVDQSEELPEH